MKKLLRIDRGFMESSSRRVGGEGDDGERQETLPYSFSIADSAEAVDGLTPGDETVRVATLYA